MDNSVKKAVIATNISVGELNHSQIEEIKSEADRIIKSSINQAKIAAKSGAQIRAIEKNKIKDLKEYIYKQVIELIQGEKYNSLPTFKVVDGTTELTKRVTEMCKSIEQKIEIIDFSETLDSEDLDKFYKAIDDGVFNPDQWTGTLTCSSSDLKNLTVRELRHIDAALKEGKNVNIDALEGLRSNASLLADEYASNINSADNVGALAGNYTKASDMEILKKELEEVGIDRPARTTGRGNHLVECHHIVPKNQCSEAVEIMESVGINRNSAANGVYIPTTQAADWPGQVTHSCFDNLDSDGNMMFRHGERYKAYINRRVSEIFDEHQDESKERIKGHILVFLEETRKDLLTGKLDFLY